MPAPQNPAQANIPKVDITWYDALVFCNRLSERESLLKCFTLTDIETHQGHINKANVDWDKTANGYRLPTEAEWEYCAKAGTDFQYSGSNDINEVAWHYGNANNQTHEVKTKRPNAWGL